MATSDKTSWKKIGKQVMIGEYACVIKRGEGGKNDGNYGVSLGDGSGRGPWLALGDSLNPVKVREGIEERIRRAKCELVQCEELARLCEAIMDHVSETEKAHAKPASADVDAEALLQAARQIHANKGILPPATDPRVLATAQAMAQAAQAAISAGEPAAK